MRDFSVEALIPCFASASVNCSGVSRMRRAMRA